MIHLDEWGQLGGQEEDDKVTMEDVADACATLIRHVMDMGSDDAVITVNSTEGGSAQISIKIIDCGCSKDKQESST